MPSAIEELAARARAARGYSGMSQKQLASAVGYSVETLSRIENGHRELTAPEAQRIGSICNVPPAFMEFGWEVVADAAEGTTLTTGDILRRIISLEAQVRDLVTRDSRREVEEHGQTEAAPGQASRPQQPPPSEEPDEPAQSDEPEDDDGPHSHAA